MYEHEEHVERKFAMYQGTKRARKASLGTTRSTKVSSQVGVNVNF